MKGSNGTAGIVAIAVAALGLVGVVAADQIMRHRPTPQPPVRAVVPAPTPDVPDEAPADSLTLTPMDKGMPPPGETLTI